MLYIVSLIKIWYNSNMIFKAMSNQLFSQPDEELQVCLFSHPGPGLTGTNKKGDEHET
jgi:hypothetical protein